MLCNSMKYIAVQWRIESKCLENSFVLWDENGFDSKFWIKGGFDLSDVVDAVEACSLDLFHFWIEISLIQSVLD